MESTFPIFTDVSFAPAIILSSFFCATSGRAVPVAFQAMTLFGTDDWLYPARARVGKRVPDFPGLFFLAFQSLRLNFAAQLFEDRLCVES
jgi:hypothetical protein